MLERQHVSKGSLTMEDGSWSTPMVPAQLSVPLQQVEE